MSEEVQDQQVEEQEAITLTEEELQKRIESESDKKLDKVLKKKQEEFDARLNEEVERKLAEDKRLAKLSETEKKEELLSQREQELEAKALEIKRSEIKSDAIADLSERGIDKRFVNYLLTDDSEQTFNNIKEFESLLNETINKRTEQAIEEKFKSSGREINESDGRQATTTQSIQDILEQANIRKK